MPACALLVFAAARLRRRARAVPQGALWRAGAPAKAFAALLLAALITGAAGLGLLQTGIKESTVLRPLASLAGSTRPVRARVLDTQPGYSGDTLRATLQVLAFTDDESAQNFTVQVQGLTRAQPGDVITLPLRFSAFSATAARLSKFADGIYLAASAAGPPAAEGQSPTFQTAMRLVQYAASDNIRARLPADLASIIAAMSVGDRRWLSPTTAEAFQAAGISHILVVSGFHLSLLCIGLQGVLRRFTKKRALQPAVCIVFIAAFMGFTGLTPSVVRSGLAWVLLCLGQMLYRRTDAPTSLALAAIVLLAVNPHACLDVGTQLSFAATLGAAAGGKLNARFAASKTQNAPLPRRALRRLGLACLVPVCTTLATLPVQVAAGIGISLAFLPANLAVVLLAPVVILCGFFMAVPAGIAVLGWLGLPASLIGGTLALWMQNLAAFFLGIPGVRLWICGLFALVVVCALYAAGFAGGRAAGGMPAAGAGAWPAHRAKPRHGAGVQHGRGKPLAGAVPGRPICDILSRTAKRRRHPAYITAKRRCGLRPVCGYAHKRRQHRVSAPVCAQANGGGRKRCGRAGSVQAP